MLETKVSVFQPGEVIMADPSFGRGLFCGRKPANWAVEFETFKGNELEQACECALKARGA